MTSGPCRKLCDCRVEEYLQALASGAETPGGGSASALAGALGAAAGLMVTAFTADPAKFPAAAGEIPAMARALEGGRAKLRDAIDADAVAFGGFAKVYAMPKATPEEKAARAAKMQETLKAAMAVPLQVMETAAFCLEFVPRLAACGNQNLITDAGVAAVLLEAAARAARLNVMINLKFIKDEALKAGTRERVSALAARAAELAAETAAIVEEAL